MTRLIAGLLALAGLLISLPASTAVLTSATEDVEFSCTGTCTPVPAGSGNPFRTAWSRTADSVAGFAADPPTNRILTDTWAGQSALYLHFQFCNTNGGCGANGATNATTNNTQFVRFIDDAGNAAIILRGTGTAGQFRVESRTSGGSFSTLVTCSSVIDNALTQVDIFLDFSAAGSVIVYKNSASACTYSGDTTNGDGATTITRVELGGTSTSFFGAFSEVIAATTDTRAMNYLTIEPGASGNATQWTGANPCTAILNAVVKNDATFVQSGTNDQLEQCTVKFGNGNAGLPAGTYRVETFKMTGRLLRGATGPQTFNFVTRTASTDYTNTDTALTTSFANYTYYQTTNPNTTNLWDPTDFSAAGFNIGLKSRP